MTTAMITKRCLGFLLSAMALVGACAGTEQCKDGPCPSCQEDRQCATATPICDEGKKNCRPCQKHAECPSLACRYESSLPGLVEVGSCYPLPQVTFVDGMGCSTMADGSRERPFCDIQEAVNAGRALIVVRPRMQSLPYKPVTIKEGRVTILGPWREADPQAVLGGLSVLGRGTAVTLSDLTLRSMTDYAVSCKEAQLTLQRVTIEHSAQGVSSVDGCNLTVDRSKLASIGKGALKVSANTRYRVVNSIFAQNGRDFTDEDRRDGADVMLDLGSSLISDNVFTFNTLIANEGAISCRLGQVLRNSIVASKASPFRTETCKQQSLFVGDESAPMFDARYALTQKSECCVDKAEPDAQVKQDYESNERPKGAGPDIGCFENR